MIAKHILLPTDFSSNARNAIDYAIYLFEKETCIFYVLNAYQMSPSAIDGKDSVKKKLSQLVKELEDTKANPEHSFKEVLIEDVLLNAIGKTAIDENISYIFMGTKGSSAIKEVFMGSNTVKVIKHIDFCPLVAVPENYSFDLPDEIGFATNFEHVYSKVELNPLINLAKLWNSTIVVVHVDKGKSLTEAQEKCKEVLKTRFDGYPFRFEDIKGDTSVASVISEYARNNEDIGMIAMMSYWHGFLEKLIKEEVIKKVTFNTEVPFLIFPVIE